MLCSACDSGQIQSSDGFSCVSCDARCQSCSLTNSYRIDTNRDGSPSQTSSCITCDSSSSILNDRACVSCKPFIFTQSASENINLIGCDQAFTQSAGFLISGTVTGYDYTVIFGSDTFSSSYLSSNLQGSYLTCQNADRRNATSCQALANMCVLKLYASASANSNTDPCSLFNTIVSPTTQQSQSFWPDNLPWLFYPQTLSVFRSSYDLTGIGNSEYLSLKYEER